jgi:hypothetical protein
MRPAWSPGHKRRTAGTPQLSKEFIRNAPGTGLGAVETISMEAYPVLYCGYHSAERRTALLSRPAERFELEGPRAQHSPLRARAGPLAHLLSSGRIGLPPARGTKAP